MELRFMGKLRRYCVERLDPNQIGFVPGLGTSVNIQLLIEEAKRWKKKDAMCMLFIDFKSAYNTIDRSRLYNILRDKQILNHEETEFLRYLHGLVHFEVKNQKIFYQNGVHQGSPISPLLFNIYMETFLAELRSQTVDFKYYAYADDLVIILKSSNIADFL
jgi:hypothetical protein